MSNRKPGRPSLSEAKKQEIRENIIQIARDLFVNSGYENTSMRKIAAQAGFAPTKIYYYFENKREILRYFWDDIARELWSYCEPPQNVRDKEPVEVIRFLMKNNVRYWLDNPKSYQLGIATQDFTSCDNDSFDFYAAKGSKQYIDLMRESVQACIDRGIFRLECSAIASQLIGVSVYGIYAAFYSLTTITQENRETLIDEAIENTLLGLQGKSLASA